MRFMDTPGQAIGAGIVNPIRRMFLLLVGSYAIGIFYPFAVALFLLVTTKESYAEFSVNLTVLPVLCGFFSETVLASGPVAIFCMLCSAYDRWSWVKTTVLGGYSTLLVYLIDGLYPVGKLSWLGKTGIYCLLILLFFGCDRVFQKWHPTRRVVALAIVLCLLAIWAGCIFEIKTITRETCLECRATLEMQTIFGIPIKTVASNLYSKSVMTENPSHHHHWRYCGYKNGRSLLSWSCSKGRRHPIWDLPVEAQQRYSHLVPEGDFLKSLRTIDGGNHEAAIAEVTRIDDLVRW